MGGAGLLVEPLAEGMHGVEHRPGRVDAIELERVEQPGQEPLDLGEGGHQALVERVSRRAHQRRDGAHVFLVAGAVGAEIVEYHGQARLVVEPVEHRTHPGVDGGDGGVVVTKLAGAAFLPAVGGGALHVPEDDVEDVDHIVAGAAGEHVGVGGKGGDPPGRGEVGQLGGPGLVGVAGQRHDPRGGYPGQIQVTGPDPADPVEPVEGPHQSGDGGCERGTAQ